MKPLNYILRKFTVGYKLSWSQQKISQLICMDDIKLFAQNKSELKTLIQTLTMYRKKKEILTAREPADRK